MDKFLTGLGALVLVVFLVLGVGVLWALPIMWLLNGVIAPKFLLFVFGVEHVGFLRALGISMLCRFLFRSTTTAKK